MLYVINRNKKVIIILFLVSSCKPTKILKHELGRLGGKDIFTMEVPKGFKSEKLISDDGHTEIRLIYSDSSIIYMTDNIETGVIFNDYKLIQYGRIIYLEIAANDSIDLEGNDNEGDFWREKKLGNIVIGYYNVMDNKKEAYDNFLRTINYYQKWRCIKCKAKTKRTDT